MQTQPLITQTKIISLIILFMAIQEINIGVSPNSQTGDSARTWATKSNDNFTFLDSDKTSKGGYTGTAEDLKNYVDSLHTINPKLYNTTNKMAVLGIDSHTEGAGGFTYRDYFTNKYLGAFGSASLGYVPFDFAVSVDLGITFGKSAGVSYMTDASDFSTGDVHYSVDGRGLYTTSATDENFSYETDKYFDYIRIYYLQKPSGGTFKYRFSSTAEGEAALVDTDGTLSIQYVDLLKEPGDKSELSIFNITGNCAFYGAWFKTNTDTASVLNIAKGGMEFAKILDLNSTYRRYWYGQFLPAVLVLNAGTNDRNTSTASEFETMLNIYIDDVQAGSPNTNIIIAEPPQPIDYLSSNADDFYVKRQEVAVAQGCDFFDLPAFIGNYATAVSNSLMLDTIHLNEAGVKLHAKYLLYFLGIGNYGNYMEVPLGSDVVPATPTYYKLDLNAFSDENKTASTEYTAYNLGLINDYTDAFFDINVYIRLTSSDRMRLKNIKFRAGSETVLGEITTVSEIDITDVYESETSGTIPDVTFNISVVSNKLVIKYTPSNDLASISFVGTLQLAKGITAEKVIYYY